VRDKFRFIAMRKGESTPDQRRENIYDAWAQALAPLACIIMILFSIPAGVASSRQSVFKGVVVALALFFLFWAVTLGCKAAVSLYSSVPPILAAVLPHALFLVLGCRLFRTRLT
jgi:lipopolysaccharide export LptBFGC system permease protein LptF